MVVSAAILVSSFLHFRPRKVFEFVVEIKHFLVSCVLLVWRLVIEILGLVLGSFSVVHKLGGRAVARSVNYLRIHKGLLVYISTWTSEALSDHFFGKAVARDLQSIYITSFCCLTSELVTLFCSIPNNLLSLLIQNMESTEHWIR